MTNYRIAILAAAALTACPATTGAVTFDLENGITGNFDSTFSFGIGVRAKNTSCGLILASPSGEGAPAGCAAIPSALGDQGDLNYAKGNFFTTYFKGSNELLLKLPYDFTFLGRINYVADGTATHTTGFTSVTNPGPPGVTDGLSEDARRSMEFLPRLLDLWVSKGFDVGEQRGRVRVGNQVISWGESLFLPGGINSTNALDLQRLSQPGTQLKEVFLAAPMISVASGLGNGFNVEAYYQVYWNGNYFPPTGSYWSVVNGLGKGDRAYGLFTVKPTFNNSNSQWGLTNQWGTALRYQPDGTQLNLGLYAMDYTDKGPQFSTNINDTGMVGWAFPKNRLLFGVSANFPVGNWAIGSEISYRPKDAVALNANASGCSSQNGNCWVDQQKWQGALTALYSATPSNAKWMLDFLHADTATLLAEAVVVGYPTLKQYYGVDPVAAGGWGWGQETDPNGIPTPVGTRYSGGYNFDFSWVYDGTLIPGWQVVPEIYYFQAVSGRTPNVAGQFMQGAKSANLTVSFIQNPANWQFAVNYAKFWGGSAVFDQPYRDRDFFGAYVSRNF